MFAHIGLESLLVSIAVLVALVCPDLGAICFERIECAFAKVAKRRLLSVLLCGLTALTLRLFLLPWLPVPKPFINDEFSFLLAGDTFAHGRLANPPHPMWVHFETFHVIFHPTYASMYPPLQGIVLAVGELIARQPFWGVWLSVGLMCAMFCWMLQAWLPPSWALLGGMLPVARFAVFSYWDNSYWGGALPTIGGALLLGALPRVLKHARRHDAIIMATGVAILANTRPYEGLMLTIVVGARLVWWLIREKPESGPLLRNVVLPGTLVLIISGMATAYYFWRVTGSPLTMPQQVNRGTYAMARYFYWQAAYPQPAYHHKVFLDFYNVELSEFSSAHSIIGIFVQWLKIIGRGWAFFLSPLLTLPLLFLPNVLRDRRIRFLLIAGAVGISSSALVVFFNINYAAPVACVILAVIMQGMRHLRVWRWDGRAIGASLTRAIVVMCLIMIPVETHILSATPPPASWAAIGPTRSTIEKQLQSLPGPQLVLVRYAPNHDPMLEWVYNHADIDNQKIVWARDMGAGQNDELLRYYKSRRAWLLEPDVVPPRLSEFSTSGPQTSVKAQKSGSEIFLK